MSKAVTNLCISFAIVTIVLETPLCSSTLKMSLLSFAYILREKFGDKYPIPTKEMPKWLVWLVAPLIDKTLSRKYIARNMGHPWRGDNSKSVKVLDIKYKPIEKSATEMFQQIIDKDFFRTRF